MKCRGEAVDIGADTLARLEAAVISGADAFWEADA